MILLSASRVWLWVQRDAVNQASRHGPKIVYRFTGIRKVNITLSLNWSMPYQGGCSQFLISSKGFDSSICDWTNKFALFGKYHLFRIESFRVDFRCVHRFQLLKVCDQYVTLPNSLGVLSVSEETIQVKLSLQIDGCVTDPSKL